MSRALQVDLLLTPIIDYRDNSVASGYTVYFYSAGTSSAKNVWTEKEKTNPYTSRTLGSDGTTQVYGDGVYKIIVKDGDGTTVYEWDDVKCQANTFTLQDKADTYTATADDDIILVDTTSGNVTINIATVAGFTHPIAFKIKAGSNNVTIDPYSDQTIDGNATITLTTEDDSALLYPDVDGLVWRRVDRFPGLTSSTTELNQLHDVEVGGNTSGDIVTTDDTQTLTNKTVSFIQSSYAVTFPTNGMAAAKIMLGNSSTIAWFYLNTAPPGWKVLSTGADTVLAISGGSNAYNVNGGTTGVGSWTQSNHTHADGSLQVEVSIDGWGTTYAAAVNGRLMTANSAVASDAQMATTAKTIDVSGTTANGAPANTDRIAASVGKLFQLDTA